MATNNSYAKRSGDHVSSIIDYVNDVKPFHTKLTAVSEKYLFSETMTVGIDEGEVKRSYLGADVSAITTAGTNPESSSWYMTRVSDAVRRSWAVPITSYFKYLSDLNEDKFTVGLNDSLLLPGIRGYSYRDSVANPVSVKKNGAELSKNTDYFVSRGILSFSTHGASKWKRRDLSSLSTDEFSDNTAIALELEESGTLGYSTVKELYGTISDISGGNYEEWLLTCTQVNPARLSVVGSESGSIGEAVINIPFSDPKISFTFTDVDGIDVDIDGETIEVGDSFLLTPRARITVNPTSPLQDWTIIKTDTRYEVYGSISGWQLPASEGVWYYNGHIGFKIPKLELWAGFSYNTEEYSSGSTGSGGVYGYDTSGYDVTPYESSDSAIVFRGKNLRTADIMCRTQRHITLYEDRVFVAYVGSTATPVDEVILAAQLKPCHYTIRFVTPTKAIVINSITQIKRGLVVGEVWTDGIVSFKFKDTMTYLPGDHFVVFLTHKMRFANSRWYDELPFDTQGYNDGVVTGKIPNRYDEEYLPFHTGHGAVIFKSSSITAGDQIIVSKAINDKVKIKIAGASARPELGSELDWIPLEIRTNANPGGLATQLTAYLAANPSESGKVFTISQPVSTAVVGNSSATLTLDPAFFTTYLPLNKQYVIAFIQEEKYGQTLAVKITEDLSISTFSV